MTHSKQQLLEKARPHFKKLGTETLYATSDGQMFVHPNRANLHASGKMAVYELNASDLPEETTHTAKGATTNDGGTVSENGDGKTTGSEPPVQEDVDTVANTPANHGDQPAAQKAVTKAKGKASAKK